MIYCVLFDDDEGYLEMRKLHMTNHLKFLHAHAHRIRAAGPLAEAANGHAAGGLWIVNTDSSETVWELIKADPFWPTGLRKSVRVLEWNQVFSKISW
jgi:uncharacterized protein